MPINEHKRATLNLVAAKVLLCVLLSPPCISQTPMQGIQGATKAQGGLQVNSQYSRYVQIMALYPPAYSTSSTSDYANFRNNVMTQTDVNGFPVVDGVTLEIIWSNVEKVAPTSTPCSTPVNTDVCQLDSVGQYHTYDWSYYDSNPDVVNYPNSIVPWFDQFPSGTGTLRKVNLILTGINTSGWNSATPWYVTSTGSSGYVTNFPVQQQDVLNVLICSGSPWSGVTGASYVQSGTSVTVTLAGCCGTGPTQLHSGDYIWVIAPPGTIGVSRASVATGSGSFTYNTALSGSYTCTTLCTYIGVGQSSPVPYEQPYTVAWEAFLAAANLHFNPNYKLPSGTTVGAAGTNQLGYIRSGTWAGGESYAYCTSTLSSPTYGVYQYMGSSTWTNDYQSKVNYVQSLSPTLTRYWPIDPSTDPDTMAKWATAAANGHGFVNGFGSQGLSAADTYSCAGANADWCNLFTGGGGLPKYYTFGMPLQLQQISISDESQNCSAPHSCGTPPLSAGNLNLWFPFAVQNQATIFEMYYLDLGLAFDSHYCTPDSTMTYCVTLGSYFANPAFMNSMQQLTWYNAVGLGNITCPNAAGCYANTIVANHGPK